MLATIHLIDVVKSFHVLAAVTWVGGGLTSQLFASRALSSPDSGRAVDFAKDIEWIGTHVFVPTSITLEVLGVWMVILSPAFAFGQFWVLFGMASLGISIVIGAAVLGPQAGRIAKLVEAEGLEAPAVKRKIRQVVLIARVDIVILVLVVFDMVLKPFYHGAA